MLFAHLPAWANIVILAVLLIGKYFIVDRIEKSVVYTNQMNSKGWMAKLCVTAGLHGILTGVLLLLFTGLFWAVVLTVGDFALHWVVGYWKIKKKLPTLDAGNVVTAKSWLDNILTWVSALHGASYVSLASFVIGYVQKNPQWSSQILTLLHLG